MYIAKKKCKFKGREFLLNEQIPEGYVLPEAATRLMRMGVIAEVPEGPLLPSESSIEGSAENGETEKDTLEQEALAEVTEEAIEPEEGPEVSKDELMKKKRDELVILAETAGLEIAETDTKKRIVEVILQAETAKGSEA